MRSKAGSSGDRLPAERCSNRGSSKMSVCMKKHVSKISCQCRQKKMNTKLFLKGLQLAYSQVLCRQNIKIQQKYMRHAKYIQPLFFVWSKFFIGTSSTLKSNLHITHREVYLALQDCA